MAQDRKKVLVLGAGYAGLQTVTKLQKRYQQKKQKLRLLIKMNITMKQHGYMKHQQVH
ncbi:NADH dehydrogenase [Staphylococcus aureus]|nr:NADH dehydrogenase [Staphylococcus aureus]SUL68304.1 NADH dehydrogenase [Staphylococcus aureus]